MSTDGTKEFLLDFQSKNKNVIIVDNNEEGFYQDSIMNKLCVVAREKLEATFILPCDSDELWHSVDPTKTLADIINSTPYDIIKPHYWDMVATGKVVNPITDIVMRKPNPNIVRKVCFRWVDGFKLGIGNHNVSRHPGRLHPEPLPIFIRHYPYRSFEQYRRKIRNGKIVLDKANFPTSLFTHWRADARLTDELLEKKWNSMPKMNLIHDPFIKNGS
jgi:hypothetical protein